MANLSINQVRHFYVVPAGATVTEGNVATTKVGNLSYKVGKDSLRFQYNSPGGVVGSDVIDLDKIMYAKVTPASDMNYVLKIAKITPKSDAIVAGQEYIVRVLFRNYAQGGDDNYTVKYGMAVATSTNASDLLKELAVSLAKNMKDLLPLATVHLVYGEGVNEDPVTASTKKSELTETYEAIMIEETPQAFEVGRSAFTVMPFEVSVLPIVKDGVEVNWVETNDKGLIEVVTPKPDANNTIKNGKIISELEWFHVGARGDYFRGFGHPYGVKTKTVADPEAEYTTLDIHYAYVGPNEGVQKSEKDITIAATSATAFDAFKTKLEGLGVVFS